MSRTKILQLIPTLDRSGAEKQLTLLATSLPRDEFDVQVVALTRGGPFAAELESQGIPVTVLGKRFRFDVRTWLRLRAHLRAWQPDILHTWLFAANAYGRLAAGGAPTFPVLVSERCVDTWKAGWQLWLDRRLLPRTTRLIGNSAAVAAFYQRLGARPEQLVVIPNGVPSPPPVSPAERGELRTALGIPVDARVVGYVGRLASQKRLSDLIWALELLRVLQHDVYLLVVGAGPEQGNLLDFAREIQIDGRVRWVGHQDHVAPYFAAMDVFWLASDFEGMSNSLMEAMSHGLPVVASDIAPNRELVIHDDCGLLFPVRDRAVLARATERLFQQPDLARRLGAAARARMLGEYGVERMVERHAALYREVASARGRVATRQGAPVI